VAALQILYAVDVRAGAEKRGELAEETFDTALGHVEIPMGAEAFAKELVVGVTRELEAIDAQIVRHARNWRIERMPAVDRNVLRLGVYELSHGLAPGVAIDEALELARRFGGERSVSFVNGVLDAVSRAEARDAP
jgi:N utilization substance protein B